MHRMKDCRIANLWCATVAE